MRLSEETAAVLTSLAKKHFGEAAEVRLFGSRVDDNARGGDIDIQIIAPASSFQDEIAFLVDVEQQLDERVDLRVQRHARLLIDDIAAKEGVILHGK